MEATIEDIKHYNRRKSHFFKRFKERMATDLSEDMYNELSNNTRNGNYELVKWKKGKEGVYKARINSKEVFLVYNYRGKQLVSILTSEMKPTEDPYKS